MKHILHQLVFMLTAYLAFMVYPGAVQAQNEPVLREQIKVFNGLVTIGDLFENAGQAAGAPVFRSPELGTNGFVAAKRIAASARQHGLEWLNPGGIVKVKVQRPGRLISLDEIRETIGKHTGGDEEAWSVILSRGAKPYYVDPRVKSPLAIKYIDLQSRSGRFRAVLSIGDGEHDVPDKSFTGRTYASVEAIVPARTIERGATIVLDDLKIVRLPRTRVTSAAIEEMDTAIGMAARQRLAIGRPLRRTDIEQPKLVVRNAMVTIVYKVPGMVLKSKGKALADGSMGQMVAVLNLRSKRTIEGQVTGPGQISLSFQPEKPARTASKVTGGKGGQNSFVIR